MSVDVAAGPAGGGPADAVPRLGGLTPEVWDSFVGRDFYSSSAWLNFCTTDFGRESAAAVCRRDGEPVCFVPYVTADDSLFKGLRWNGVLTRRGLPAPAPGGLLVGAREGYQTRVLGASGATTAELAELVAQLRSAAAAEPTGQSCVAMYMTTADVLALRAAGVTTPPVMLEADAWIELPDSSWESWEASLSRNRRKMVRRDVRNFRESGYRIEQVRLPECWHLLGEVASATQAKYGHRTTPEIELKSLRSHVTAMGDDARVALLHAPDDRLVGFCLYYAWQDTVYLRWLGIDYDRLTGAHEYFNMCYYAQIECAAELGVRWLHAGTKSVDAKAFRGARLRPLWLLDLTENSALTGREDVIYRHNAERYAELKADPVTAEALDEEAWLPFR